MTWTTKKPTVPGWYWWRRIGFDDEVVYVFKGRSFWHVRGYVRLSQLHGEWAGPLEVPK